MSTTENTSVSQRTPFGNFIAEAIHSGPYPHGYIFTHVTLDYGYPRPWTIMFQCMCEYDTNVNITAI